MYVRGVPRLARTVQTALDELDWPCPLADIEGPFLRRVRVALGWLPEPCFGSIARVATALVKHNDDSMLPRGYGGACVRHFWRRNEQLKPILNYSVASRFALIELTSLASIAGQWAEGPWARTTPASRKECLRDVAELSSTAYLERERWRVIIELVLNSPTSEAIVLRNISYALVWCGYFSPDRPVTDEQIAQQFFHADRATFVRGRLEALRWLPKLLEISLLQSPGGAS